eukprot:PhM_4_TR17535/c0_g1_i1/m.15101
MYTFAVAMSFHSDAVACCTASSVSVSGGRTTKLSTSRISCARTLEDFERWKATSPLLSYCMSKDTNVSACCRTSAEVGWCSIPATERTTLFESIDSNSPAMSPLRERTWQPTRRALSATLGSGTRHSVMHATPLRATNSTLLSSITRQSSSVATWGWRRINRTQFDIAPAPTTEGRYVRSLSSTVVSAFVITTICASYVVASSRRASHKIVSRVAGFLEVPLVPLSLSLETSTRSSGRCSDSMSRSMWSYSPRSRFVVARTSLLHKGRISKSSAEPPWSAMPSTPSIDRHKHRNSVTMFFRSVLLAVVVARRHSGLEATSTSSTSSVLL